MFKSVSAVLITVIALLSLCLGPVAAAEKRDRDERAERILAVTEGKNRGVRDFRVRFRADVVCMGMRIPLTGEFMFKRPDKIRVRFDNMPAFLSGYKRLFKGLAPSGTAYGAATRTFVREEESRGGTLWLIRITPSKNDPKKNIRETYLWINRKTHNPDLCKVIYRDGSSVETENSFPPGSGRTLPSSQKAALKSGMFHAKAFIRYGPYKINGGLSDDLFRD